MNNNTNQHIHGWLEKIEENIKEFRNKQDVDVNGKLEFISHHYHLIMLIHKALNGQVIFVGAKPIDKSRKK